MDVTHLATVEKSECVAERGVISASGTDKVGHRLERCFRFGGFR